MYAEPRFPYQKVYDAIVSKIWENKDFIFGNIEQGYGIENWSTICEAERVTSIENKINTFI